MVSYSGGLHAHDFLVLVYGVINVYRLIKVTCTVLAVLLILGDLSVGFSGRSEGAQLDWLGSPETFSAGPTTDLAIPQ